MNSMASDKKKVIFLVILLTVALIGAGYYYIIYPLQEEKQQKISSIQSIQASISEVNDLIEIQNTNDESSEESLYLLRKKVPASRELNQIIRSIQEIELVSESKIEAINFNNYDGVLAESDFDEPVDESEEGEDSEAASDEPEETAEETEVVPISPIANIELYDQLKLITFNIQVLTKDFESLNDFLKEVEVLERIVRIDAVNFTLQGEEQEFEPDATDSISAEIQVTTFFYSGE